MRRPIRRVSKPLAILGWSLLSLSALAALGYRIITLADRPDPRFICQHPSYRRIHSGQSKDELLRILGKPTTQRRNPNGRDLPTSEIAERQRILDSEIQKTTRLWKELETLRNRPMGQRDKAREDLLLIQLYGRFNHRDAAQNCLDARIKETWDYQFPDWHGHIEITLDFQGHVLSSTCGYC